MNDKKHNLRPPTEEEIKEMFKGIIQENREHGHIPPRSPKCNQCAHRIPATAKCSLLYPQGIPLEITKNKVNCKRFKQK